MDRVNWSISLPAGRHLQASRQPSAATDRPRTTTRRPLPSASVWMEKTTVASALTTLSDHHHRVHAICFSLFFPPFSFWSVSLLLSSSGSSSNSSSSTPTKISLLPLACQCLLAATRFFLKKKNKTSVAWTRFTVRFGLSSLRQTRERTAKCVGRARPWLNQ